MTTTKTLLDAYRRKSKLPPGFEQVFAFLCERHLGRKDICDGFGNCLKTCRDHGFDEETATTLLIGLQAVQVWYLANRANYEDTKKMTAGNSRYAPENAIFVSARNQTNKFAKRDYECKLILGYMDTFSKDRVEKQFVDPVAPCVQRILGIPDYYEIDMANSRAELEKDPDGLNPEDLKRYERDHLKDYKRKIAKLLSKKINTFIQSFEKTGAASTARRRAITQSRKLFKQVHSSRTSVN